MATADIEMKDFPVVSTAASTDTVVLNATVNGEKANVQIKISDLATVVAACLGFSNCFLMNKSIFSGDLNTIGTGLYYYNVYDGGSVSNAPSNTFGYILSFMFSNSYKAQIAIVENGGAKLYIRNYKYTESGYSWSAWSQS